MGENTKPMVGIPRGRTFTGGGEADSLEVSSPGITHANSLRSKPPIGAVGKEDARDTADKHMPYRKLSCSQVDHGNVEEDGMNFKGGSEGSAPSR